MTKSRKVYLLCSYSAAHGDAIVYRRCRSQREAARESKDLADELRQPVDILHEHVLTVRTFVGRQEPGTRHRRAS